MDHIVSVKNRLSKAISIMRFPLIVMIVMLHCYSSVPFLSGSHTFFHKALYPFGLWMGETGVPAFFFISGYLFFISSKTYVQKIKTRFSTLMIPYLLWNGLILLGYVVLFMLGHPQQIADKNIADYGFTDYLLAFIHRGVWDNGNGVPLLCPYWYVRNLIVLCLLSPVVYYLVKWTKGIVLFFFFFWWLSQYHNAMIASSVFFFSLGSYFAIDNNTPTVYIFRNRVLFLSLWGVIALTDILSHSVISVSGAFYIHRLSLLLNVCGFLLVTDLLFTKSRFLNNKMLANSAFWIFTIHYPIVLALRKACVVLGVNCSDGVHILLFFICVILTVLICIVLYHLAIKVVPTFVRISMGNRV